MPPSGPARAERLEGRFPVEIAPLARETNALIDANREIVERARTHVGNLAHALKTPLSVMVNEATARGDDPLAVKVREQTDIMRDQVTRHLERARLAARLTVVGNVTDVLPVVSALARTMEKIYLDRGIAIDVDAPKPVRFKGEQPDLEEMVGNLVDNACKWAHSRVSVEVFAERMGAATGAAYRGRRRWTGPDADQREQVTRRGQRLDETKPAPGSVCRSWSILRRSTAAASHSGPRRSAACGPNLCCRPRRRILSAQFAISKVPVTQYPRCGRCS